MSTPTASMMAGSFPKSPLAKPTSGSTLPAHSITAPATSHLPMGIRKCTNGAKPARANPLCESTGKVCPLLRPIQRLTWPGSFSTCIHSTECHRFGVVGSQASMKRPWQTDLEVVLSRFFISIRPGYFLPKLMLMAPPSRLRTPMPAQWSDSIFAATPRWAG
jgi:hypothetical protein